MMKRVLAVAVVGVGLLGSSATQRPVTALVCANCAQELTQMLSWGQNWVEMGKQLKETQAMVQQGFTVIEQGQTVWNAATRITDLGSAVSALGTLGIANPLPVSPYALQSLLNGTSGVRGGISTLSSLFDGTQTANRVYAVQGGNFVQDEMIRRGSALAGSQAVALQLHQSAADRSPMLGELRDRLNSARDPTEREALMARLQYETAQIANQQVQATSAATLAANQIQVNQLRQEERLQQSIDEALVVIEGRQRGPVMMARAGQ